MFLVASAALASSAPVVASPPAPFRVAQHTAGPRLAPEAYAILKRRHQRTIGWGFVVGGVGIPVFATGLGVAALGAYANSAPWTMFGANLMGVGIAANVTGTVVATRALTLYDREFDDLEHGRLDVDTLASYRPKCQVRTRMVANGLGGTF